MIQRLGNDALLMGSRRRMGAAPVVVGGADPIAADVTTTAGLGDGVHDFVLSRSSTQNLHTNAVLAVAGTVELGASLMWIEALLAWTMQVRVSANS
eukprot:COSAG02_NODE_3238_length_7119_cov_5.962536_2_plen_96_part_00